MWEIYTLVCLWWLSQQSISSETQTYFIARVLNPGVGGRHFISQAIITYPHGLEIKMVCVMHLCSLYFDIIAAVERVKS